MTNGINDELILAARLLLAALFLIFGVGKAEGLFGHDKSDGAAWRSDAGTGRRRSDLHGASGRIRGRCRRVHTSFGFTYGFIHAGNCAYRASLLDGKRARITSTAWTAFTKISPLWEASCCCTLPAQGNIRSTHYAASPRRNPRAVGPTISNHSDGGGIPCQESSESRVQIDQKIYEMPPKDGMTIAHFIVVADVERSLLFYEKVFGSRILSRGDSKGAPGYLQTREHVAHRQCRRRSDAR